MFTIRIKGERSPKDIQMVRLKIVFYRTGYSRITKAICISGLYKDWNQKKQCFAGNTTEINSKNHLLRKIILKYLKVAERWEFQGKEWTPLELSHYYDEHRKYKDRFTTVSSMLDHIIDYFMNRKRVKNGITLSSANTAKGYKILKRSLESFTRLKYRKEFSKFLFRDINEKFITEYGVYVQQQGAKKGNNGGVYAKLKYLRATFTYARKKGIYGVDISAFDPIRDKFKSRFFIPKAITSESMRLIENTDRSFLSRCEQFHLDLFLFSYYAGGISNIDICFLTRLCVKKDELVFERIKCNKQVRVILIVIDKAKDLIEKYRKEAYMNYVFPIFKRYNQSEKHKYELVCRLTMKVNKTLYKICSNEHIREKVTWSTARSCFISMLIDKGYHPLQIAEQVGNNPQTIYKYYYVNTNKEQMRIHLNELF
ncbi:phage integrase SAM-like domain-containing protein [Prevotella sp. 10(H)]|uniref:phage integrase SAM-like domain-containing protein n=1 Tax=Prevotella sp. 10(H) TaxID=1158294 RepID=UPI0004A7768D|nr:phage integrase SAM-like domain-containing protein [Prevotella sp. 10(H)]